MPREEYWLAHPVKPWPFAALAAPGNIQAITGDVYLYGWALLDTTGAALARLELYDGYDANSLLIAPVNLLASESSREWFGDPGLTCERGIFVNVLAGSVRGSIFLGDR